MTDRENQDIKEIGLHIAKFSRLRNQGYVYVDKTDFVHGILTDPVPHLFLSRPRRFGKTLLIDTLEEAAIGRKELFSGLAIDKLRGDGEWHRSHVLRISMNSFGDDPAMLDSALRTFLRSFAFERGFSIEGETSAICLREVIRNLSRNYIDIPLITENSKISDGMAADKSEIIVLIDEYDAPVINNITDPKKIKIAKETLHGFYNALKSCENMIDRIFITGITKFSQLSLFSALNNLEDISFDSKYAAVCGFTFDEIDRFYSENIDSCLLTMRKDRKFGPRLTKKKLMSRIREWYDGYSWDGDIHVINPLSIQKFLTKRNFGNFWSQTGGTNLINTINLKEDTFHSVFQGKTRFSGSISIQDAGKIDPAALMLQTGYLTVRSQRITSATSRLYLTVPNREVGMTVMEEYVNSRVLPVISGVKDGFTPKRCREFCEAFCQRDNEKAEKLLQGIFSVIPYRIHLEYEAFYHVILLSIFRATDFVDNFDADAESNMSGGIIDFVVVAPDFGIFVVEIKYSKSSSEKPERPDGGFPDIAASKTPVLSDEDDVNLELSVKEAFAQIIDKGYMVPYLTGELPVYAAAVAVCGRNNVRIRSLPAEEMLARASEYPDASLSGQAKGGGA
ncbi:MAG: ATP-binding protein [Deltaproteobacteria bacterium]|jgi:hypothetical protein|nr:ATP-binding protein [Deltaproteobacteria bacterium]